MPIDTGIGSQYLNVSSYPYDKCYSCARQLCEVKTFHTSTARPGRSKPVGVGSTTATHDNVVSENSHMHNFSIVSQHLLHRCALIATQLPNSL